MVALLVMAATMAILILLFGLKAFLCVHGTFTTSVAESRPSLRSRNCYLDQPVPTECDTNLEIPVALRFPLQKSLHHGTDCLCRYRLVRSCSHRHLGAQLEKA